MPSKGYGSRTETRRCRIVRRPRIAVRVAAALLPIGLLAGCVSPFAPLTPSGLEIVTASAPSEQERYCAWFGDRDGDTLYVGLAPFWSAMRAAGGDPTADLRLAGPQLIGRFDLTRERWREPLRVDTEERRSGVWDVHARGGQVVFTTFYEPAGRVDVDSGHVVSFDAAGRALNEIADGPAGRVLVSRYGSGEEVAGDGELVALDSEGSIIETWPLRGPPGFRVAPKTPAWDPARGELWTTADLLATDLGGEVRHDSYVVGRSGALHRIETPELQFVAVAPDGRRYAAEVEGGALWLRVVDPPDPASFDATPTRRILVDPSFPRPLDFVQDLKLAASGRVILMRWSGTLHVVEPDGTVLSRRLPRIDPEGLYYTAVQHGDRICATYCADVTVVCLDAPTLRGE